MRKTEGGRKMDGGGRQKVEEDRGWGVIEGETEG